MNLGKNIYNLRKKNGLSQEELAEKINVTRQTISNWELGETYPNPEQLKLLSELFEVSIDSLVDNNNFITDNKLLKKENTALKDKRYKVVLFCYFLCSIIWLCTTVVNFIDNNFELAIMDLMLFTMWIIITLIWYRKIYKK